jgi:hypothetical protein
MIVILFECAAHSFISDFKSQMNVGVRWTSVGNIG